METLYLLAAITYLLQLFLFAWLNMRGNLSLLSQAVSDYGVGPTKRLFLIYGLVGITAAFMLAAAVLIDERFPLRAGLYLVALALLRFGVLAFPTDLEGKALTRVGALHYFFAIVTFALLYMAIDVLHPRALPHVAAWAQPVLDGFKWLVTLSLVGLSVCLIPALRRIFGLLERIYLLSTILWLGLFAFGIWQRAAS